MAKSFLALFYGKVYVIQLKMIWSWSSANQFHFIYIFKYF